MLTAGNLIDEAAGLMLDTAKITWDEAFWMDALNKAITQVCNVKGDAAPLAASVSLVAGTLQQLPDGYLALIDIQRNTASGKVCTLVDRELLDEENRFWPAGAETIIADHYAVDPRTPRVFWVMPPNSGGGALDGTFGVIPDTITDTTDPFPLLDVYRAAVTCFMLAQAYAQNTKRQDLTKHQTFTQEAFNMLGTRQQNQLAVSPRVSQAQGV